MDNCELLAKRGMDGDIFTNVLFMLLFVIFYHAVGLFALTIRSKTLT
uniref:Ion_trans domain-containing protein n=1 Tax=Heterorhabditis bacteriophora TaxID=37862 RepID=A0A1I7X725_HETBA